MHKQFQVCTFRKLLSGRRFQCSPKPTNPFSLNWVALAPTSTQLLPRCLPSPGSKFLRTTTSNLHNFKDTCPQNSPIRPSSWEVRRSHGTESGGDSVADFDVNKEVDLINLKFADAREEIESALDSNETVYFDEEAECARAAVKEVLDLFDGLLGKLPEREKTALQRSMGLKMEQLKAELLQLED
uniref:Uncharacterized protein n=1 Tax=Rhizophora mucronata TaxID=61149 RepID=A0A2P2J6F4_RHIMU